MGKAQSKRSVDITTETKKGPEDEITEKMEKIEDLDKKEVVNGDATMSEKCDSEKKDAEDVENDKDMTTEKDDGQASGDSAEPHNNVETSKDGGGTSTAEDISPLADESIKKSKKEKVKKKWSFRSISFGKKDKQKPAKNEDAAEDASAAINGADTDEKAITEPEDSQMDKSTNESEIEKTTENQGNGSATPQALNGEQKNFEENSNDITANTTNNTTNNEMCEPVQIETAAASSELSEKTEKTATATIIINETKMSENASNEDASKNGNGTDENINATKQEPQKTDVINASVEAPSEKTSTVSASVAANELSSASTNGEVVDKIHQNGDHDKQYEHEVVEKTKAQIEVNSNTDNNVSAVATLDSISFTSINPSNVQIHVQDLNASGEKPDEIIQIYNDESSSFKKSSIDFEVNETVAQPLLSEDAVSMTEEVVENNLKIETIAKLTPEMANTEKSEENKHCDEPSPPPLPISPPPSQVSVFAFTNNEESVKDSFQTEISESTNNKLIEEKEEIPSSLSQLSKSEFLDSEYIDATHNEKLKETIPNDPTVTHAIKVKVEIECGEIVEEKYAIVCNDLDSTGLFVESQNGEESSVAAAVINEITEKAAEIVTQQLECNVKDQQITNKQKSSQSNEERQEEIKCDIDEIINETTIVVEFDNKDNIDRQYDDKEFDECELTSSSKESPPLVPEQTNNIFSECSLDSSASNEMVISLNKSKDNIDEENLNPTKEFSIAKDIKDNVTVAEITKDLSVTCE